MCVWNGPSARELFQYTSTTMPQFRGLCIIPLTTGLTNRYVWKLARSCDPNMLSAYSWISLSEKPTTSICLPTHAWKTDSSSAVAEGLHFTSTVAFGKQKPLITSATKDLLQISAGNSSNPSNTNNTPSPFLLPTSSPQIWFIETAEEVTNGCGCLHTLLSQSEEHY